MCSSSGKSDTSHDNSIHRPHNGGTNNGSEGHEIHVSDVIVKANEVLFDAHADVSDASELHVHVTMSTPHSLKVG